MSFWCFQTLRKHDEFLSRISALFQVATFYCNHRNVYLPEVNRQSHFGWWLTNLLFPCLQFFLEEWFVSNNIHHFAVCTLTCVTPRLIFTGIPFWNGNKYAIFSHIHPFLHHAFFFNVAHAFFFQKAMLFHGVIFHDPFFIMLLMFHVTMMFILVRFRLTQFLLYVHNFGDFFPLKVW